MGRAARAPRRPERVDVREALRRSAYGSVLGAALAAVFLLVGLARALLLLLRGRSVGMDGFALGAVLYAVGFAVAGGAVGLLWPVRRSLLGRSLLGIAAATIVGGFILRAMDGPIHAWTEEQYVSLTAFGLLFGLAAGYQFGKNAP